MKPIQLRRMMVLAEWGEPSASPWVAAEKQAAQLSKLANKIVTLTKAKKARELEIALMDLERARDAIYQAVSPPTSFHGDDYGS